MWLSRLTERESFLKLVKHFTDTFFKKKDRKSHFLKSNYAPANIINTKR